MIRNCMISHVLIYVLLSVDGHPFVFPLIVCHPEVTLALSHTHFDFMLIDLLRANFCRGNINMQVHFMSFLRFVMMQAVEILLPSKTRTSLLYIVDIMGADALTTQGARALATMILTMLNQINSVPARLGLMPYS